MYIVRKIQTFYLMSGKNSGLDKLRVRFFGRAEFALYKRDFRARTFFRARIFYLVKKKKTDLQVFSRISKTVKKL